jgi:hypothetical protein
MPKCVHCGFEVEPLGFCLNCSRPNALGSAIFACSYAVFLSFIGERDIETIKLDKYEDPFEISIRNLFQFVAEKIHGKRMNEIFISGENDSLVKETAYWLKKYSLHPISITLTDTFPSQHEFILTVAKHLRIRRGLKKVYLKPEEKLGGAHSTIVGGREGVKLLQKIASSEYVKKIVLGVIEAKGTASGGVRLKLTRSDGKGNIRALLINGATVQRILVITTAGSKEEGEEVLKILEGLFI